MSGLSLSGFRLSALRFALVGLAGLGLPGVSRAVTAPPQLLPYTVSVVVGGGPYNSNPGASGTYVSSSNVYTAGSPVRDGKYADGGGQVR